MKTFVLVGLFVLAGRLTAAAAASEWSSAKVYKGGDGVKVVIVRLKPLEAKRALVKITGSDTNVDGAVVAHEIDEWDGKIDYWTRKNGARYVTITVRDGSYEVYLPNKNGGIWLAYDEKASSDLNPATLIEEYEKSPQNNKKLKTKEGK